METQDMQGGQATLATDPVCGMDVDPATAAATSEYQGKTYYFCAVGCKNRSIGINARNIWWQRPWLTEQAIRRAIVN